MSQPPAVENFCSNPRVHKAEVHYQRGTLVESRPCWQVVLLPGPVLKRPFHIGIHYDQVQNFSQYAEATPSNIKSLVKDVGDFEMQQIKVDQSCTQFIWLPMLRPVPSLSSIPPDLPIPFLPYLYFKSQISCNLYAFNIWTSLTALAVTHAYPHVPTLSLLLFLRAVPAKHWLLFFLTLLPKIRQADTSYQGQAGRWFKLIKGKPQLGNNWSTATITAAEKAKDLFPATVNEVHQQINYSKVPTPHGGFARYILAKSCTVMAKRLATLLLMASQRL